MHLQFCCIAYELFTYLSATGLINWIAPSYLVLFLSFATIVLFKDSWLIFTLKSTVSFSFVIVDTVSLLFWSFLFINSSSFWISFCMFILLILFSGFLIVGIDLFFRLFIDLLFFGMDLILSIGLLITFFYEFLDFLIGLFIFF